MQDKATQVSASIGAISDRLIKDKAQYQHVADFIQALLDEALSEGWHSVASRARPAVEALDEVGESIQTAETSCGDAQATVDKITDQMSTPEVQSHFADARADLKTGSDALFDACTTVDRAKDALAETGNPEKALEALGMLADLP